MVSPIASGSFAMAATVIAGTPLARKPMPGPEPSEKSIELATIACCSRASPPKRDRFDVEVVLGPDPFLGADLERRKGESGGGGLADADGVGGTGIGQASRR